ncbi:hypothetical protein RO3G_03252 [Rhizopus delemar RA 99-880]|uniref:Uncharacterized protein n=1 Tax=Rhizopus delemar (strain RA 99-880 / ATCC MYA-4621 / FGSC 9543 / NRRL 43880) TaxID=246409 RepID=I1BQR8_RHIO9|nr:hypothetical protein RO3G_03252 [Rhizopus delemar RA 99-880]|eukprot:EIE78548.1 hypothetical protein RO3G_03252 [Rhizopus delemar RA 99-880]
MFRATPKKSNTILPSPKLWNELGQVIVTSQLFR